MTRITGTLCGDQYTFMIISLPFLFRIRNFSHKSYRETQNTHFVLSNFPPPPKIFALMRYVEKYCRVEQATGDSMAHALCVLHR